MPAYFPIIQICLEVIHLPGLQHNTSSLFSLQRCTPQPGKSCMFGIES